MNRYILACIVLISSQGATGQGVPQPPVDTPKEIQSSAEIRQALLASCNANPSCAVALREDADYRAGIARGNPNLPPNPLADMKARKNLGNKP